MRTMTNSEANAAIGITGANLVGKILVGGMCEQPIGLGDTLETAIADAGAMFAEVRHRNERLDSEGLFAWEVVAD